MRINLHSFGARFRSIIVSLSFGDSMIPLNSFGLFPFLFEKLFKFWIIENTWHILWIEFNCNLFELERRVEIGGRCPILLHPITNLIPIWFSLNRNPGTFLWIPACAWSLVRLLFLIKSAHILTLLNCNFLDWTAFNLFFGRWSHEQIFSSLVNLGIYFFSLVFLKHH